MFFDILTRLTGIGGGNSADLWTLGNLYLRSGGWYEVCRQLLNNVNHFELWLYIKVGEKLRMIRSQIACFDEVFMSDCELDQKSAKAAFVKGGNILLALQGCSSSAASHFLSQLLMLGVVVLALSRFMNK
ncbi:hypothetical protein MTO96_035419 [Rhipicephalus appendiculatus]